MGANRVIGSLLLPVEFGRERKPVRNGESERSWIRKAKRIKALEEKQIKE